MFLAQATIQYFIMVIQLNTFSRLSFIHGTGIIFNGKFKNQTYVLLLVIRHIKLMTGSQDCPLKMCQWLQMYCLFFFAFHLFDLPCGFITTIDSNRFCWFVLLSVIGRFSRDFLLHLYSCGLYYKIRKRQYVFFTFPFT